MKSINYILLGDESIAKDFGKKGTSTPPKTEFLILTKYSLNNLMHWNDNQALKHGSRWYTKSELNTLTSMKVISKEKQSTKVMST
jgi:hypothetical protein